MTITLEQAKNLKPGDMLHHTTKTNADGTPMRWKVNGMPKTWKTKPYRVKVPVKHGLRDYDYLEEDSLDCVNLAP